MRATSTRTFLLISVGSISMWIFLELGRVLGEVAGDAVVEAHAEGEEEVGLLDGVVDPGLAVHAHHAEGERVGGGDGAEAEQGAGDGDLVGFGEGEDFVLGAGLDDAVAGEDDGLLGDCWMRATASRMEEDSAREHGVGAVGVGRGGVEVEEGGGLLRVLGDVDEDGAGAAGAGDLEGLADGGGDVFGAGDEEVVLGDGQGDAGDVDSPGRRRSRGLWRRPGR